MKPKLIFVCLAIALVQIAPLNAQSVSPEGRYTSQAASRDPQRECPMIIITAPDRQRAQGQRAAASGGRRSHEDAAGRVYLANAFSCVHLQGETVSCG